jgi:hypothetical protein
MKPVFAGDFVQQFGNANARHHGIEPVGENFSYGGRRHFDWGDLQPVIDKAHTLELIPFEPVRKLFQPPIEFPAAPIEPFVGRGGGVDLSQALW